ncbi:MAG: aldolase [Rhodomicrobium sp.]
MHATCIALGHRGALLKGPAGAGKSDLALRFLSLSRECLGRPAALVADDQVILRRQDERLTASCPMPLTGKIEVRGLGIANLPNVCLEADLKLVVSLDRQVHNPRFPEHEDWETILGLPVPRITLDPFELSAPMKLALAIGGFFPGRAD